MSFPYCPICDLSECSHIREAEIAHRASAKADWDILAKIKAGTHVLVPVEPTEAMITIGRERRWRGFSTSLIYCAMITAAQEGK